ncbi:uncharacterized protein SPPG_06736 [Spizellomyces punctatus DAOM BR117]|uniref:F-box domain-containing protein n=1 Tax=Spizellomyces punctatus (strain DAOM BR117) TaxID=645134 RepID=A0A0L0H887_SPIPD|nr:uncharacterized protein SPPG_06736 [Spizellomyces punctatus DAOM BR117]KNC97735.1 hypothetical protein SPPG_06736 [Spizellomyces punctatus DAOM BR117]|eukprot:XP_016605775.1 hypothetical protein SPPG_06736 [Spizellomyces punctatus DAOM BR117]
MNHRNAADMHRPASAQRRILPDSKRRVPNRPPIASPALELNHFPHTSESVTAQFLQSFPQLSPPHRHSILLALLKQCNPADMVFLAAVMPRLHRDFLRLLPREASHRIVFYIHPRDFCTVAQVSKAWRQVLKDRLLWQKLYTRIGLGTLATEYYQCHEAMKINAKRLHSLSNWTEGQLECIQFKAHNLAILSLCFDGKRIVTAGADKLVRMHDAITGECVMSLSGQDFTCVQFDDRQIITGSADGMVRIWASKTGTLLHASVGHTDAITCLKFSSMILITGSADRTVKIWELAQAPANNSKISRSRSPTRNGRNTKTVAVENQLDKVTMLRTLTGHQAGIKCLDFTQYVLISGDVQGCLRIWHVQSGNCLSIVKIHTSLELPVFFSLRKMHHDADMRRTSGGDHDPVSCICYNGRSLLFSTFSGRVFFYDVCPYETDLGSGIVYENIRDWANARTTFKLKGVYKTDAVRVASRPVATLSTPRHTTGTGTGPVAADGNATENLLPATTMRKWTLCAQLDEWKLIAGSSDGRCIVWNHLTGKSMYCLKGCTIEGGEGPVLLMGENCQNEVEKAVTGLAFDDKYVVVGSADGLIRVWSAKEGTVI